MEKRCVKCDTEKDVDLFPKQRGINCCLRCHADYRKAYYHEKIRPMKLFKSGAILILENFHAEKAIQLAARQLDSLKKIQDLENQAISAPKIDLYQPSHLRDCSQMIALTQDFLNIKP